MFYATAYWIHQHPFIKFFLIGKCQINVHTFVIILKALYVILLLLSVKPRVKVGITPSQQKDMSLLGQHISQPLQSSPAISACSINNKEKKINEKNKPVTTMASELISSASRKKNLLRLSEVLLTEFLRLS